MSKPKWVIMVYIAADDTLANFAIESLKQLKETATDEVVVVAQFDPGAFRGTPGLAVTFSMGRPGTNVFWTTPSFGIPTLALRTWLIPKPHQVRERACIETYPARSSTA